MEVEGQLKPLESKISQSDRIEFRFIAFWLIHLFGLWQFILSVPSSSHYLWHEVVFTRLFRSL